MRKIALLVVILGGTALAVRAQETPAGDVSAGYSFLRAGFSDGINQHGGNVSVAGNVNNWLGIAGDFGAYHGSPAGVGVNTYTFLAGPRLTYRKSAGIHPFAQVLLGGAHVTAGLGDISGSTTGFAYSTGGGLDIGFSRHVALRPQVDYIGIRAGGGTLNTVRASFGIVFKFGSK